MQTCATCCFFVVRSDDRQTTKGTILGDCIRFPPEHIISGYRIAELEANSEQGIIAASGVPARPLSLWFIEPEYASAFRGVNVNLKCGEWKELEHLN